MDKGGRPRKYKTPEELNDKVDEYVAVCKAEEEPITWTGMALHLGFYGRQEMDNYQNYDGFSDTVKRAKAIVQNAYEKRLAGNSPTGAIFALKNMGWSDKHETAITGGDGGPLQVQEVKRVIIDADD